MSLAGTVTLFRSRILWLAVLPLVGAVATIGALLWFEMLRLEHEQERLQEEVYLSARRDELRSYIQLALTSIEHLYGRGRDDSVAKTEAQAILRAMNFGTDGYFFVYDTQGRNLVHPRQPELEGRPLIDLQDRQGVYVIRELIQRAKEGGGFQRYEWPRPSTGQSAPKLGYAVLLERWGWMLGTGLYIDDIDAAAAKLRENMLASAKGTLSDLGAVAVIAALVVFAGGLVLNLSDQRVADRKIRLLADRVVRSQEEERTRVSRDLHDHICQLLVSIKYRFEFAAHRVTVDAADGAALLRAEIGELSRAIGEVRRISHDLRPALLDDLGLPAALDQLGDELSRRTGLRVALYVDEPVPSIAPAQQAHLFRIAQEALRNVEQHAGARAVDIGLARGPHGGAVLRIADDGAGFDVEGVDRTRGGGIGLSNMRQRAEAIGARLAIRSEPGRTAVEVGLPA